ncbi:MAG TPA: S1 RNA-binding domain-containing protein [Candidatus Moranbacteria bacterium]|nr:S1 RNA-binding domain-containing protein [Candidatus Moranbacteria bacterium]
MSDILDNLAKEVDKLSEETASPSKKVSKETEKEIPEDNSVMSNLLSKGSFHFPKVSDTIDGKVIYVSSNEIYLDLPPFGTGIVLGKEIKDGLGSGKLKIGDTVNATIIDMENENGYIELSIREASCEKAWDDLESKRDTQEKVNIKVLSANKGGLLVEVNSISGFLPVSQLSGKNYPRVEDGDKNKILNLLKKLIGQELEVRIIDADRETEKLIVSEKAAQSEKDMEVISALNVGDTVSGEISGVVDFGAFVKFSIKENDSERKLEGLVHISELAWQLIEDPRTIVKVGDKVSAKIIGIDGDKISLSIRALQEDPWSNIAEKYKKGDIVSGTVNKINHFGAFVYLDKDIHGLAHISEMSENYPGKSLNELIKAGEKYNWEILSIEPKEHRMGLVLAKDKKKKKEKEEKVEKEEVGEEKEIKKEKKEKKEAKKKSKKKEE